MKSTKDISVVFTDGIWSVDARGKLDAFFGTRKEAIAAALQVAKALRAEGLTLDVLVQGNNNQFRSMETLDQRFTGSHHKVLPRP